ncbi:hypothetical protein K469DRAFT_81328 [Zopfia rhizophila CBS 207.26]|uniref:Uncharacterized protein n=1 Tax=Zopfia rhizophila CBS 207.26 TaxID=1314779 RepID=A0A6A6DAU1_9PEZI|nr:hypothetical protein K469DRAFT_81328 [Zopfia rhizophila CBS 207.26]
MPAGAFRRCGRFSSMGGWYAWADQLYRRLQWAEETEKFQRDDPKKWLTWHGRYLTKKKYEWETQAKNIYLQSCGFRIGDLKHLE